MGCYGIGTTRLVGAIVETHHDEKGIIWPKSVAPFHVEIVSLGSKKAEVFERILATASALHDELEAKGVEVLWDDRDASAGEKFADADLIGIPLRFVISEKTLSEDSVEWKERRASEAKLIALDDAVENIDSFLMES